MITTDGAIKLKAIPNNKARDLQNNVIPSFLSKKEAESVRKFHMTFSNYKSTPLVSLKNLAKTLGVSKIFVKDESHRFGLGAFKVLGGSFAIGKFMSQKLGIEVEKITFDYLKSEEVRNKIGGLTFTTATDGNHGRGVAWAAQQLGQKAVIYLPKGSAKRRVEAIRETGAEAYVTDLNYDDTVRFVMQQANKNGWQIVQDTAWKGYTEIPTWIMQGYTTMADEALEQLDSMRIEKPTHVFLQAGVGAMAGAVLGYYVNIFNGEYPITAIVEPDNAACVFQSALVGDGKPHAVKGDLNTIMVGLACGEPHPIAWEILRDFADMYISCPDYVAARGIRILANPLGDDEKVIAGESGAVGLGLLSILMQDEGSDKIRRKLNLNENSIVLIFNTEGDTDPVNYRQILWDGKYPLPY